MSVISTKHFYPSIESLITMDATQRYKQLMESTPTLIQRLYNKIIADYLGISQETWNGYNFHHERFTSVQTEITDFHKKSSIRAKHFPSRLC